MKPKTPKHLKLKPKEEQKLDQLIKSFIRGAKIGAILLILFLIGYTISLLL